MKENPQIIDKATQELKNLQNGKKTRGVPTQTSPFGIEDTFKRLNDSELVGYVSDEDEQEMLFGHLGPLIETRINEVIMEAAKHRSKVSSAIVEEEVMRVTHLLHSVLYVNSSIKSLLEESD